MIDWHSHILPRIDDGSHSSDESLAMLQRMAEQGVDTVIATPHFYPNHEKSVDAFLERRAASEARLRERMANRGGLPRVICGAEVNYFPGISRMDELDRLTIGGGRMLLLEMPFVTWTEYTIRELMEMINDDRYTVLLAHMERYWWLQDKRTRKRLLDNGIHMQTNASTLIRFSTRRKALQLLKSKHIRFLGSDAHNMTSRPPEIGEAYDILRDKLGDDFVDRLDEYGREMLGDI